MSRAPRFAWPQSFILLTLLALPFSAHAIDLDVKIEPGAALSLSNPQSQRFEFGFAGTVKGLVGSEGGWVNAALGLTFLGLPAQTGFPNSSLGTAWAPSFGLRVQLPRESEKMRLMRPHESEWFLGAKPWVDADLMYVRTGGLDRVGFAAAVGISYPIGEDRQYQFGPFVRYMQIFQGSHVGFDTRDANTIILGLSLETGTRVQSQADPVFEEKKAPVAVAMVQAPPPPPPRTDRDGDGVYDDVDACPDMPGPAGNAGCPVYEKVVVKPDMLELKEKIQFAWNTPKIEAVSYPALDEVAKALNDNKGFRISIEGHASSEGNDDHNQNLSNDRAEAVLEYIAHKGVARDRLTFAGFSSSRPLQTNTTEVGREANRRVEFVVHFIIIKEGSAQ